MPPTPNTHPRLPYQRQRLAWVKRPRHVLVPAPRKSPRNTRRLPHFFLTLAYAGAILISASGCLHIADRTLSETTREEILAVIPTGPPEATIIPHGDAEGWSVQVFQRVTRHLAVAKTIQQEGRTYVVNPVAVIGGLLHCPMGLLAMALVPIRPGEQTADEVRDACLQLLMLNRSPGRHTFPVRNIGASRKEAATLAISEAEVLWEWKGPRTITIPYPVSSDGRAVISLSHLATVLEHEGVLSQPAGAVSIVVTNGGKEVARAPQRVSPASLQAALKHQLRPILADRWPTPVMIKVLATDSGTVAKAALADRLMAHLVQQRIPVAGDTTTLAQVEQEHNHQASGRVEDATGVGPGHGKGATVLLSANYEAQPQGTTLTLRVVDVRTTEILGMARVKTGPHTAETVLIDMAIRRLDQLLQSVPK